MRLQHRATHRHIPACGSNVQSSHVGPPDQQGQLGAGALEGAFTLIGQAGAILQQHHGGLQVAVGGSNVQRCVALVGIQVDEPAWPTCLKCPAAW